MSFAPPTAIQFRPLDHLPRATTYRDTSPGQKQSFERPDNTLFISLGLRAHDEFLTTAENIILERLASPQYAYSTADIYDEPNILNGAVCPEDNEVIIARVVYDAPASGIYSNTQTQYLKNEMLAFVVDHFLHDDIALDAEKVRAIDPALIREKYYDEEEITDVRFCDLVDTENKSVREIFNLRVFEAYTEVDQLDTHVIGTKGALILEQTLKFANTMREQLA